MNDWNTFLTGMLSAAASLGLSLLWDADIGLSHVDKYTYSSEEYIKVRIRVYYSGFPPNTRRAGWRFSCNRYP